MEEAVAVWEVEYNEDTHLWVGPVAILFIVPMGLRVPAGGVLWGVYKAGHVILTVIGNEKCTVDAPGGSLVKSPSASDFSEVQVFRRADSG